MNTSLARRVVLIFMVAMVAGYFTLSPVSGSRTQGLLPGDKQPTPQAFDSQKTLPPLAPRIKTKAHKPFQGIQSTSPRSVDGSASFKGADNLRIQPAKAAAQKAQPADLQNQTEIEPQSTDLPNLFPYQPPDWDGPVVLSTYTGNTFNSRLVEGQNVYVDWSIANGGLGDSPDNFVTCLYLDYVAFYCTYGVTVPSGYYWPNVDLFTDILPEEGWHAISIIVDTENDVIEDNEGDNIWSAEFYWEPDLSGQNPNLLPYNVGGLWSGPVVLSSQPDQTTSGGLVAGQPFFLNMAAVNEGPGSVFEGQPLAIEILIDNIPVYMTEWEWGLPSGYYYYQNNYLVETTFSEGWHWVDMYVDFSNAISEGNETDNNWSGLIYWEAPAKANLIPYTQVGWDAPVKLTSTFYENGDTRLFADTNTYFYFSYANIGNAEAKQFYVNILLDDVFISYYLDDLQPGEQSGTVVRVVDEEFITPGWHTVKLWLDDLAAVDEYNEADNIWEADFYWETSSKPNLYPAQLEDWDDAIVISSLPGTNQYDALTAGQPVYLDWSIINGGWGDVVEGSAFQTRVLIDGNLMDYWEWPNVLPVGWYLFLEDYPVTLSEGWHYIELFTDAENTVQEGNEADNGTGIWVYLEPANSKPEVRVEPASITLEVATGTAAQPTTLRRDMARVKPMDPAEHGTGAEITPPTRYILPDVPLPNRMLTSLPPAVDHSSKLPPVGSQGGAGSCVGWATSYYYKSFQEGLDQGWALNTSNHQFSPNFVWDQIQISGTCGGTFLGDAYQLLQEKGDVPLSVMPYTEDCHSSITQQHLDVAASYRAENYGQFFNYGSRPTDAIIEQMKAWLASGDMIQIAIPVTPEFDSPSGPYCMVEVPNQGPSRGGHAIAIVGYDDNIGGIGKKGFKIVNSWGIDWGCGGFAYLSYDWIKSNAKEAWWMNDIRTGASTFRDFTIFNDGDGALTVSDIYKQGNSSWLQIVLPQSLPMVIEPGEARTVQVSFNTTGLTNGWFEENITIISDDTDEPQNNVEINLNNGVMDTPAPASAKNPQPNNGAINQPGESLNLAWGMEKEDPSILYDVRLDTVNPPMTVVCNDQSNKACVVRSLRPNTTYYWRVVSQNNQDATLSPVWSFTTRGETKKFQFYLPVLFRP